MSCCRKFPPGNGENYDGNSDDDGDDNNNDDGDDDGDAMKSSQQCSRHLCEVVFVRWVPSGNISRDMLAGVVVVEFKSNIQLRNIAKVKAKLAFFQVREREAQ